MPFFSFLKRLEQFKYWRKKKKNVKPKLENLSETERRLYEAAMHLICKSAWTLFDMVSFKETFKGWEGSSAQRLACMCSHML